MFLFDSTFNSLDVLGILLLAVIAWGAARLIWPAAHHFPDAPEPDDYAAATFDWPTRPTASCAECDDLSGKGYWTPPRDGAR